MVLVRVIRRKPRGRLGILRDCTPGAALREVPVRLFSPAPELLPRGGRSLATMESSGGAFVVWEGAEKRQSTPPGNRGLEAEEVRQETVPSHGGQGAEAKGVENGK